MTQILQVSGVTPEFINDLNANFAAVDTALDNLQAAGVSAANSIKGNNTGGSAATADLTVAQTRAMMGQIFIGFTLTAVNFNTANNDNPVTLALPTGYTRYRLNSVIIDGATETLTTATFGVFTAAAGAGTAIVASGTACTINTASEGTNNNMQFPAGVQTLTQSWAIASTPILYFRTQTGQPGTTARANVQITIQALP